MQPLYFGERHEVAEVVVDHGIEHVLTRFDIRQRIAVKLWAGRTGLDIARDGKQNDIGLKPAPERIIIELGIQTVVEGETVSAKWQPEMIGIEIMCEQGFFHPGGSFQIVDKTGKNALN